MVMYQLRVQSGDGNRTSHLIRKKLRWEFPTNERWVTRREEKKSRESKNGKREPQWPALGPGRGAQGRIKHEEHPLPKAEVQTHCRGRGCGPVLMEVRWVPWASWSPAGEQEVTHLRASETHWVVITTVSSHAVGSCATGDKNKTAVKPVRKPWPLLHLALSLQRPLLENSSSAPADKGKTCLQGTAPRSHRRKRRAEWELTGNKTTTGTALVKCSWRFGSACILKFPPYPNTGIQHSTALTFPHLGVLNLWSVKRERIWKGLLDGYNSSF